MHILEVVGNIKHDGNVLAIGSRIEAEIGKFSDQIEIGVLKIVETLETGAEETAPEAQAKVAPEAPKEETAPIIDVAPEAQAKVAPLENGDNL